MTAANILQLLNRASDPLVVADVQGRILWSNVDSSSAAGPPLTLQVLVGDESARELLAVTAFDSRSVQLQWPGRAAVSAAAGVVEVGSAEPGGSLLLIAFKSAQSDSLRYAHKSEILDAAAHDLKNPLGAIFGYADVLLDTPAGDGLDEKQRQILSRIRATASRSMELVRNYQYVSQFEQSQRIDSAPVVDLNTAAQATLESTWRDERECATLRFAPCAGKLPVRIEMLQLERVLANLIGNALKYTPASGSIVVSTFRDAERAGIRVSNNEPVIPAEELATIFERRRRGSTSRGKGGTGLGLYIVQRIVESNNGSVRVESSAASGTTFTVTFPEALTGR